MMARKPTTPVPHRLDTSSRRRAAGLLPLAVCTRRGEVSVAALLGIVGAAFVWRSLQLDLGRPALPGPGFFPLLLGASLVVSSGMIAVEGARSSAKDGSAELGHRDVLIAFGSLLMVPLLFQALGAYVALGALGTVLLVFIARTSPLIAIPVMIVGMMACWLVFQVLLGVQLPLGDFWDDLVR
jgi:hypothetical protein